LSYESITRSKKSRTNRPYIFRNRDKETLLVFCTQEKLPLYVIVIIYYRYTQTRAAILILLKKIINLLIYSNKLDKLNKENL